MLVPGIDGQRSPSLDEDTSAALAVAPCGAHILRQHAHAPERQLHPGCARSSVQSCTSTRTVVSSAQADLDLTRHRSGAHQRANPKGLRAHRTGKGTPVRLTRSRREALDQFSAAMLARFGEAGPDAASANDDGTPSGLPFGEMLVAKNFATQAQVDAALVAQPGSDKRLGEILIDTHVLTAQDVAMVLAAQLGLRTIDLNRHEIDTEAAERLPAELARELRAIPVAVQGERIFVAASDPVIEGLETRLIETLEAPVGLLIAADDEMQWALDHVYSSNEAIDGALRDFEDRAGARRKQNAESAESVVIEVDENAPIVQVVNVILEQAVRDRASDVHIEPQDDSCARPGPHRRRAARAHDAPRGHGPVRSSQPDQGHGRHEHRRAPPAAGRPVRRSTVDGRDLDVRVATIVDRLRREVRDATPRQDARRSTSSPSSACPTTPTRRTRELIRSPYGMVVCAGPTGSGKTTTLYATLAEINDDAMQRDDDRGPGRVRLPDDQPDPDQRAGRRHVRRRPASRSSARTPTSILVGEIRDVETARIAVQAALTGHFVLSSLHATDAASRAAPLPRHGHRAVPDRVVVARRRRPAARAPDLPALHRGRTTPTAEELAFYERCGGTAEDDDVLARRGLQLLRQHRLPRPRRRVRGAPGDRRDAAS